MDRRLLECSLMFSHSLDWDCESMCTSLTVVQLYMNEQSKYLGIKLNAIMENI